MRSIQDYIIGLSQRKIETVFYNYYWKKFDASWQMKDFHSHNAIEILYCIDGKAEFLFEETGHRATISKGDVFLIRQNVPHRLCVGNNICSLSNVSIYYNVLQSLKDPEKKAYINFYDKSGKEREYISLKENILIGEALSHLVLDLTTQEESHTELIISEVIALLIRIQIKLKQMQERDFCEESAYVSEAMSYINSEIYNKITVQEIADHVHISAGYLMRLFKQHLGMTIMDVVTNRRLEKSKALLMQTNLSVTQIALLTGHANVQTFSMSFKKYFDCSPSTFRKKNQEVDLLKVE